MTNAPKAQSQRQDLRNRQDCDEAVEAVAEKAAVEIARAWTDQQSESEALVRIDGILGEATGHEAADGGQPRGRLPKVSWRPQHIIQRGRTTSVCTPTSPSSSGHQVLRQLQRRQTNRRDGESRICRTFAAS